MSWSGQVVGFLREAKTDGMSFEVAWAAAMMKHPPRGPGMGRRQMSLLDEDGESLVTFLQRSAEDAWYGRKPLLRHLSVDLLDVPEHVPVRRALDRVGA